MDLARCATGTFSKKEERRTPWGGGGGGRGERRSLINTVEFYGAASHPWTATLSALPLSSAAPGSRSWLLARCCGGDGPTLGDERELPVQHHATANRTKHSRSSDKPNQRTSTPRRTRGRRPLQATAPRRVFLRAEFSPNCYEFVLERFRRCPRPRRAPVVLALRRGFFFHLSFFFYQQSSTAARRPNAHPAKGGRKGEIRSRERNSPMSSQVAASHR